MPHTLPGYHCHPCSSSQVCTSICRYRDIHRVRTHVPRSGGKYSPSGHAPFCRSLHVTWLEQKNHWLPQKLWLRWSYAGSDLTSFLRPLPGYNPSSQRTPLKRAWLFPETRARTSLRFSPCPFPTILPIAVMYLHFFWGRCYSA